MKKVLLFALVAAVLGLGLSGRAVAEHPTSSEHPAKVEEAAAPVCGVCAGEGCAVCAADGAEEVCEVCTEEIMCDACAAKKLEKEAAAEQTASTEHPTE
ncbi:MAG: hypothetical protein ABH862_01440 [Candidatus Omnitrophota bacterium]